MNDHIEPGLPGADFPLASSDLREVDLRINRIVDYTTQSLAQDDALAANLGAINANLMGIEHRLHQAIELVIGEIPTRLEAIGVATPAIADYLKLVKQIDRFSQLAIKLRELQTKD